MSSANSNDHLSKRVHDVLCATWNEPVIRVANTLEPVPILDHDFLVRTSENMAMLIRSSGVDTTDPNRVNIMLTDVYDDEGHLSGYKTAITVSQGSHGVKIIASAEGKFTGQIRDEVKRLQAFFGLERAVSRLVNRILDENAARAIAARLEQD